MILSLIDEAQRAGARLERCCSVMGLDPRTVQRWRDEGAGDDGRHGPKTKPGNKLSEAERARVLEIANSPEFRDRSPHQIVALLAERGDYVASESTFFRILREENQLAHRGRAKAPTVRPVQEHVATGPNQVWSWDITYLRSPVCGVYFYLYMFMDVWSRKIVAAEVRATESSEAASDILLKTCRTMGLNAKGLVIHQDNGSPMKGSSLKATMEQLGVISSFSRPRVSDDNPYSESLFRTVKYHPTYPRNPFHSATSAQTWVDFFTGWYNHEHLHSGIGYVTPGARHDGTAAEILKKRRDAYELARRRHPERWARHARKWDAPRVVLLNPSLETRLLSAGLRAA